MTPYQQPLYDSPPAEAQRSRSLSDTECRQLLRVTFQKFCFLDPAGELLPWLKDHAPDSYVEITETLPGAVEASWAAVGFEAALDDFLQAIRRALVLQVTVKPTEDIRC